MSRRIEVCPAEELPPGERTLVEHGDGEVGVFNVDGEYYALENACPHLGGPVCEGKRGREIEAEYVEPRRRLEEQFVDTPTLACPWHGWEFRLATGEHLGDDSVALRTYDVLVNDGTVYVEL